MLSASALANKCPCVEYRTDVTCGGCGQSTCATVCLSSVGSGQAAGWDQLFSGFSLKQHSGKLVVAEVLPASPAEDGGVRVGDEVVAIDGMRVPLCRNQATVWQSAPAEHSLVVRRVALLPSFKMSVWPIVSQTYRHGPPFFPVWCYPPPTRASWSSRFFRAAVQTRTGSGPATLSSRLLGWCSRMCISSKVPTIGRI